MKQGLTAMGQWQRIDIGCREGAFFQSGAGATRKAGSEDPAFQMERAIARFRTSPKPLHEPCP